MSDRPFCYSWVFLSNFEYIGLFWGIPDYFWPFLALLLWQICSRLQAEESEAARPARGGEERCGGGRCKTEVKASFRPTLRVSRGPSVVRAEGESCQCIISTITQTSRPTFLLLCVK